MSRSCLPRRGPCFRPLVAIVLALITKEVYSSLFIGILIGGIFYSGFTFEGTITHVFQGGIISVLSDSYNVGIIVFLVILGIMVCMMNKVGGSAAFGEWAKDHIKTRTGAQLSTILLGVLIFIDDYFNCLTVGSVMRPVTDKHQIIQGKAGLSDRCHCGSGVHHSADFFLGCSRDGIVEGEDGFSIFIRAIPYNFYALLTIVMMIGLAVLKVDYGSMRLHEDNAIKGDIYTTPDRPYADAEKEIVEGKGRVIDLVFPIVVLIICCVIGMIYTGGFFSGTDFVTSFSQSDASVGLVLGSFFAYVITIVFYMVRRVIRFGECMSCVPDGFKAMVPAILILTFAWSLKAMTDSLGADVFVSELVRSSADGLNEFPARHRIPGRMRTRLCHRNILGTFGILIPIVVAVFSGTERDHDDHLHLRLHGRCCVRRPLLAHLGHHDHVVSGSPVQPCEPCHDAASLRDHSGGHLVCRPTSLPGLCRQPGSLFRQVSYLRWECCLC